ncbi:MAG: DUF1616 domain-containing protein, partial [Methanobacterium sp.]|nr:DUF1616 domain-containing protein [Methanobacterium sp.]
TGKKPENKEEKPENKKPYKDIVERVQLVDKENEDEQSKFDKLTKPSSKPTESSKRRKIFSVVLIIFIVLIISAAAYTMMIPKTGNNSTIDFYVHSSDGNAINNTTLNLVPNQEGNVIIGIVNHENSDTSYRLLVTSNGTVQMEQNLTLKDGEKVEIPFNFTAGDAGEMKMEFLLYKLPDNNNIYRSLHLWLNITSSSE